MIAKARPSGLLALLFVVALGAAVAVGGCGSPKPVVQDLNHLVINSPDPQALFTFFTGTLGLPEAWPYTAYPGYATGGVHIGNVNVEALGYPGSAQNVFGQAFFYGLVMEPYPLKESVPLFKARGAEPSKPKVQTAEINGTKVPMWTNVNLQTLCTKDYLVYLCEYTAQSKAHLQQAYASAKAPFGPLGAVSVKEAVLTSKDPEALQSQWKKIMAPVKTSADGAIEFGTSPSVRITKGSADEFQSLVIEVTSLSQAKSFLEKNGLLGSSSADELKIDPSKVQGLDIRLVQAPK
jgi:hypothetical protein